MAGMNGTTLSLEQTPPITAPLRFFLTAPLFATAAGLFLLIYGPDALLSRWAPWTLALTHLLTLGFLTQVMFGAVQQLLPVLMGSPLPRPDRTAAILHALLTLGTIALVAGLMTAGSRVMMIAVSLLGISFLGFTLLAGYALVRARSAHVTVTATGLSVLCILLTAALGSHLAAGYAGLVPFTRQFVEVHLGLGLLGWVGLLLIGVAYQVVPMFQITPDYPKWLTRGLAPFLFTSLVAWASARLTGAPRAVILTTAALLAIGYTAFALATLRVQQRRRRRLPDVTLDFWRVAMVALLATVVAWVAGQFTALPQLLIGTLYIVGFGMSAINGMLYKIVPFLIWLHLNNRYQGLGLPQTGIPNMKQIIPERHMRQQLHLHVIGLLLLIGAIFWPLLARIAALLFIASSVRLAANLFSSVGVYRRVLAKANVTPELP